MAEKNLEWIERTGGHGLPIIKPVKKTRKDYRRKYKDRLMAFVREGKYSRALRYLKRHESANEWLLRDLKRTVRQEMKCLERNKTLFSTSTGEEDDSGESEWDKILDKIKSKAPTVFTAFLAAISTSDEVPK